MRQVVKIPDRLPFLLCPILVIPTNFLSKRHEIPLVSQEKTIELADGRKMTVSACCDFLTYVKLGRIKPNAPPPNRSAQDEEDSDIDNGEESEDEIGDEEEAHRRCSRRR